MMTFFRLAIAALLACTPLIAAVPLAISETVAAANSSGAFTFSGDIAGAMQAASLVIDAVQHGKTALVVGPAGLQVYRLPLETAAVSTAMTMTTTTTTTAMDRDGPAHTVPAMTPAPTATPAEKRQGGTDMKTIRLPPLKDDGFSHHVAISGDDGYHWYGVEDGTPDPVQDAVDKVEHRESPVVVEIAAGETLIGAMTFAKFDHRVTDGFHW